MIRLLLRQAGRQVAVQCRRALPGPPRCWQLQKQLRLAPSKMPKGQLAQPVGAHVPQDACKAVVL